MTTNYFDTFITVSPDSAATHGRKPAKAGSIASIQYSLLRNAPYTLTSEELLFEVHVRRNNIDASIRAQEQEAFFNRSHACLRASPLVKQYGWGLHHDASGRVALYGIETDEYRTFATSSNLRIVAGMRNRRS
ncbi:DUF6157 family protein [Microvirga massiliensis]|uniref:DUF6157 family protein n=1 Tax=Microvirga massiliensis TaxID=1033741 RepID=UPI00062BACD2|nr:DUF6157 family protein [Microvirga massiliensis]